MSLSNTLTTSVAAVAILSSWAIAGPLGSGFTYQGEIRQGGIVCPGPVDLRLSLWDAESGGTQIDSTQPMSNVSLANGLFTVELNGGGQFGSAAFDGSERWLQVDVRFPAGGGSYTPLSRQKLTAAPYALHATGNWSLTGNADTSPGTHFIGTTDNQPLEMKVNGLRALQIEPHPSGPNIIGGGYTNQVTGGVFATAILAGRYNAIHAFASIIGGGTFNTVSGEHSTVLGGSINDVNGDYSSVVGGYFNTASGKESFVGGGYVNIASGQWATVAGGALNAAGGRSSLAAGYRAVVRTAAQVGGGDADGDEGTFVWADSTAADFTSTGPNQFNVRANGGVYLDTGNGPGVRLNAANRALITRLHDPFTSGAHVGAGRWGLFMENYTLTLGMPALAGAEVRVARYNADSTYSALATFDQDGNLNAIGTVTAAGFNNLSDARLKEDVEPISNALQKVSRLTGVSFNWRQDKHPRPNLDDNRHLGLIAQDVKKVLPEAVSQDSKGRYSVAYSAVVSVLVEAVKEQHKTIDAFGSQNTLLEERNKQLEARLNAVEAAVAELTARAERSRP